MDPSEQAESSESLAMGLLVVLETLSPLERAVFVLHEAFGLSYAEIAHILGRQEAAVRQSAHRARGHVAERRPRYIADPVMHRRLTERFLAATVDGDVEALIDVLAPDVVLVADGGGKVRAPRLPVRGAEQVIRFLRAVAGRTAADQRAEVVDLNGSPGLVVSVAGQPVAALTFETAGSVVRVVYLVADPDKLRSLSGR
jgi:RNA polymerase sigma-70 factor (ECF subfamily)